MPVNKKSRIIRIIVCAALVAVLLPTGFLTGVLKWDGIGADFKLGAGTVLKLIVMVAGVIGSFRFSSSSVAVPVHSVRSRMKSTS